MVVPRETPHKPPLADTRERHNTKEISQYAETFLIFAHLRLNSLLHAQYNSSVNNHFASIDHVLRSRVACFLRKTHDVLDPLPQAIRSGEYRRRYLERATSGTMTDYLISDPPKSGNEFRLSQENFGDWIALMQLVDSWDYIPYESKREDNRSEKYFRHGKLWPIDDFKNLISDILLY